MPDETATIGQMPGKGQLLHAYNDPKVNIRRYIDVYVETGSHDLAICMTKYGLVRKTAERAAQLGVPIIRLSEQAAYYDVSVTRCLDLVACGDDWKQAIARLDEIKKHDDERKTYQKEYVQLRRVFGHAEASHIVEHLISYWNRFAVTSGADTARHVRKVAAFGRLGLKSDDLRKLLGYMELVRYWERLGAAVAAGKVTADELRVIASKKGNVNKYVILKEALGDLASSCSIEELARTSHQGVTEIKLYAGWRRRGRSHKDSWERAFRARYVEPID